MGTGAVTLTRTAASRTRLVRVGVAALGVTGLNAGLVYPALVRDAGLGWALAEIAAVMAVVSLAAIAAAGRPVATSTALYCPPTGPACYIEVADDGSGLSALRVAEALGGAFVESEQAADVREYDAVARCPGCGQLDTHPVMVCPQVTRECLTCGHSWRERLG